MKQLSPALLIAFHLTCAAALFAGGMRGDGFIENRGQIIDSRGAARPDILFSGTSGAVRVFVRRDGLSFVTEKRLAGAESISEATGRRRELEQGRHKGSPDPFAQRYPLEQVQRLVSRIDIAWPAALQHASVAGSGLRMEYCNYYLPQCPDGITRVPVFDGIECASPSGAAHLQISTSEDGILISSSMPMTRVLDDAAREALRLAGMECEPETDGSMRIMVRGVTAAPPAPTGSCRNWASYLGGTGDDWLSDIRYKGGYLFVVGATSSPDFPVTPGVEQTTFGGISDMVVAKFDIVGNRIWATYLGRSGSDCNSGNGDGAGLEVDGNDDVLVSGSAESASFPVTPGAVQSYNAGISDAVLCKFDHDGLLRWATYFGGSDRESFGDISVDAANNIYVCGSTLSADFPVTPGALDTVFNGPHDAVMAKFTPNGALLWSTFLGGNDDDGAVSLAVDPDGNVVVVGSTTSPDFPVTSGAFQGALKGGKNGPRWFDDMFITKMSPAGTILWSTFAGGNANEYAHSVAVNAAREIAVTGYTVSSDFPVVSAYQPVFGGSSDAIIMKLSGTGAVQWSTYFGGKAQDPGQGVAFDAAGNIAICGNGGFGVPFLPSGVSDLPGGGYVAVFTPSGQQLWGAMLGLCEGANLYGIDAIPGGDVCVAGNTSWQHVSTGSAFQRNHKGNRDGYIARVSLLPPPCISAGDDEAICAGESIRLHGSAKNGLAPLTVSWAPAGLLDDASSLTPLATVHATTTFVLSVVDANGCVVTDTVMIRVLPAMAVDAGVDVLICRGETTRLGGSVSGGSGSYNYQWTPAWTLSASNSLSPWAIPDSGTTYILTVTDAYGCTAMDSVTVRFHPYPLPEAGPDAVVCRGDLLPVAASVSGGHPPFRFEWEPASAFENAHTAATIAHPGASDYYIVAVIDSIGCIGRDTLHVFVNPLPPVDAGGNRALCSDSGVVLGSMQHGGNGPLRYSWSPAAGLSATNIAMPVARPLATTLYTVTVTDAAGCRARDSALVVVAPRLSVKTSTGGTSCAGQAFLLQAQASGGTPPYRYRWAPEQPLADPSAFETRATLDSTTLFHVWIADNNGCAAEDSIRVRVLPAPLPAPVASGPTVFCAGDSVALEASMGFKQYIWTVPDGSSRPGRSIIARYGGMYRISVTDDNGCIGTDTIRITARPPFLLGVTQGPLRLCAGDSSILTAESGYRDYEWLDEHGTVLSRSELIVVRSSGRYMARARDSLGCFGYSDTTQVTVFPLPVPAIAGPRSVCVGSSVVYTAASTGGREYKWRVTNGSIDSGDGSGRIVVRWGVAGTASLQLLEMVDSSGCADSTLVTVIVGTSLAPAIIGPAAICAGDTAWLQADADYANVEWKDAAGSVVGRGRSIAVSASGSYSLVVSDGNGCTGTSSAHVLTVHPLPTVRISGSATLCDGDSITLDAGDGFARYQWRDSLGAAMGAMRMLTLGQGGTYSVQVWDSAGCSATALHQVSTQPRPVATILGPRRICEGDTVLLDAGAGFAAYRWLDSTGVLLGAMRMLAIRAGGVYTLEARDSNGCTAGAIHTVSTEPSPRPVITGAKEICSGDSAMLDAGDGFASYEWRLPDGVRRSARSITATAGGRYLLTVTNAAGCDGSAAHVLSLRPLPLPVVTGPDHLCEGDTALLRATPGFMRYEWREGATLLATSASEYLVTRTGAYRVEVTDSLGCRGAAPAHMVTVHALPAKPIITQRGDTLVASAAFAWQWLRNDTAIAGAVQQRCLVLSPGVYTVLISDAYGCTALSDPVVITKTTTIQTTVQAPTLHAVPGATVRVPIRLASESNIAALTPRAFSAELRFNKTLLFPSGNTPVGSIQSGERVIPFNGNYSDTQTPLSEMTFTAMLGDSDRTALRLSNFAWSDPKATAYMIDGEFLLDICREGGNRLFVEGARFGVVARPNPFNTSTVIEYTLVETGPAQLFIVDALGRRVATLLDGEQTAGTARMLFDAGALASGVYHAVLRSATMTAGVALLLVK